MKMLVDRTPLSTTLPVDPDLVKLHIRIDGSEEEPEIEPLIRTATAELEQVAQIALLHQTIRVNVIEPEDGRYLRLPIGPVQERPTVRLDGSDFTDFGFVPGVRSLIYWGNAFHARRPDHVELEYRAGFGGTTAQVPHDLAQAVMDQAGLLYQMRSVWAEKPWRHTSPHLSRIAARYRGVQV